ncbi:MAG: UTP--glucose-1-phosphate uridylyltransferase GalU [Patescibacteria group bacterium]|nr:UTP--glucose-1-phosphate uridylyltransferase GalU [Patescibacteria group bacterium]
MGVKKAVILVGGYGTRFLPATKAQPKEMLPIVDKPVVQYIVEEMAASGIREIIFVTSQTKRAIEDHFNANLELENRLKKTGNLKALKEIQELSKKVKFVYIKEPEPCGNGYALLYARKFVGNEAFAFSDGDSIIDSKIPVTKQLLAVFKKYRKPMVAVNTVEKKEVSKYGIIDGQKIATCLYKIKGIIEKPDLGKAPSNIAILGMRYILTPDIFPVLEKQKPGKDGEIWLSDAINQLAKKTEILAFKYKGKYHDCGNKLGYLKAVVEYGLKHTDLNNDFRRYLKSLRFKL